MTIVLCGERETRVDAEPARFAERAPCLYAADGRWYADCADGKRLEIRKLALGGVQIAPAAAPPALQNQPVALAAGRHRSH